MWLRKTSQDLSVAGSILCPSFERPAIVAVIAGTFSSAALLTW
jgi:hypothetical protein